jgi:8-oxo-dGTP pyrophosphatase MutT (NUDIX family)
MQGAKYTESAGGVVVNVDTGDVLVVRQPNKVWSLPKGHIEPNEDPLLCAKREIFEESGVTELNLLKELGKYKRFKIGRYSKDDESEIKTIRMYLFTTDQRHTNPKDPKHPEAKWLHRYKVAKELTHEKDAEFFNSVLNELPPIPDAESE